LVGVVSQQLLITQDRSRRVLACEVMNVNNAIRNLIREMQVQQVYSVVQTGRSDGMMTMNDSLKDLCDRGLVNVDTAMSRSPRPKELARMLQATGRNGEGGQR
jgi:twitching motility protein PilT